MAIPNSRTYIKHPQWGDIYTYPIGKYNDLVIYFIYRPKEGYDREIQFYVITPHKDDNRFFIRDLMGSHILNDTTIMQLSEKPLFLPIRKTFEQANQDIFRQLFYC